MDKPFVRSELRSDRLWRADLYLRLADDQEGEELSIDYGLMVDGRITRALRERFSCLCGAANCRGTLLAPRTKKRRGALHARAEQTLSSASG